MKSNRSISRVPRLLSLYSAFFHAVKINSGQGATSFNRLVDPSFDSIGPELEAQVDGGFRVRVDTRDYRGRVLWVHGSNDRKVSRVVNALLRSGDILLDIGASYASIGLAAAERVGPLGHVHLFEPQPSIAQAVDAAIREADVANVSLHELALFSDGQAQVPKARSAGEFVAQLVGERPFGVKIDLEEAEADLLSDLLPFPQLRFVVCEGGGDERRLFDRFVDAGFAVFALKGSPLRCRVQRVDAFSQGPGYRDFVAVRRSSAALPRSLRPQRLAALNDG
jgi:hypothetical protein